MFVLALLRGPRVNSRVILCQSGDVPVVRYTYKAGHVSGENKTPQSSPVTSHLCGSNDNKGHRDVTFTVACQQNNSTAVTSFVYFGNTIRHATLPYTLGNE